MSLFKKVAGKLVENPAEDDQRKADAEATVAGMYDWLRTQLDAGCADYQATGNSDKLRECLTGQALADVAGLLDEYRERGVVWSFPERRERANQRIKLQWPVEGGLYVITEYYRNFGRLHVAANPGDMIEGDGTQRALRVSIKVDGDAYWISDLALLSEPD